MGGKPSQGGALRPAAPLHPPGNPTNGSRGMANTRLQTKIRGDTVAGAYHQEQQQRAEKWPTPSR